MNLIEELKRLNEIVGLTVDEISSVSGFVINDNQGWRIFGPGFIIIDYKETTIRFSTNDTNEIVNTLLNKGFTWEEISQIFKEVNV